MFGSNGFWMRRLASIILLAALLAYAPIASALTAALITQSGLTRGWDQVINNRLTTLGFTVTVIDHQSAAFTTGVADSYDLIFISESAASGGLAVAAARTSIKPVFHCENLAWDEWFITSTQTGASSTAQSGTAVTFLGISHPILTEAGFTPTQTVTIFNQSIVRPYSTNTNFGSGVVQLASIDTVTALIPVWAVESGAALSTGTAPARRAAMPLVGGTTAYTAADMTADGFKLFDAIVHWLVPASAAGDFTVNPTSISISTSASVTTRTITVVCNPTVSSITLTAATLNPAGSPFSLVTPTLPVNILSGTTATLRLVFTPTSTGTFQTTATLSLNNSNGPKTANIPVSATATVNRVENWSRFE